MNRIPQRFRGLLILGGVLAVSLLGTLLVGNIYGRFRGGPSRVPAVSSGGSAKGSYVAPKAKATATLEPTATITPAPTATQGLAPTPEGGGLPGEVMVPPVTPTRTPTVRADCFWTAEFHSEGYPDFSSANTPLVRECASDINFDWGLAAPHPELQGQGQYWGLVLTREVELPAEVKFHFRGTGSFYLLVDEGSPFDRQEEDEFWWDHRSSFEGWDTWSGAPGTHKLKLLYAPKEGIPATFFFEWMPVGSIPIASPTSTVSPTPAETPTATVTPDA